jgi:phage-related minor tail protein
MARIRKSEQRAINNLKAVETTLGVPAENTARTGEGWKIFQWLVVVAVISDILGALAAVVGIIGALAASFSSCV